MPDDAQRPVHIGIPIPTTADVSYNTRCWPQYAEAVREAGGEPVSLALNASSESFADIASGCDGFVLPGSPADVDPTSYGQQTSPSAARPDPAREACDLALLAHAAVQGKPVLAICFGLQILNVWRGGSLIQDLPPIPVNHAAGGSVIAAHSVQVERESLLASLLTAVEAPADDDFRRLLVNSSHHQAIGEVGEGLAVVARSTEDGVIEAVEVRMGVAPFVGVQWHPERSAGTSQAARALFVWIVSEAEDRRLHVTLGGIDAGAL